jgi:UDP-3-O-[3-hydroxymyristoyl] glucosamine N-acyltransferase
MRVTLNEIVARLGGEVRGDGTLAVSGITALDTAQAGQLSFLSNPKYREKLASTRASAVIVAPDVAPECPVAAIVTPQPYLYFAKVAQWLQPQARPPIGVHATAVVEGRVAASASIGANVWIGPEAEIGEHVVIEANCSIGRDCRIGADAWLHAGVTVYAGCRIGARAIIHSGVVIGSDGFGFAREADGAWVKIPQTGRVLIGDDVEIGANTTIDRGALEDTVIEDGVKLDNLIQVAHNVHIGAHTAIAACAGIAGSAHIGKRCMIGGAAMIHGHLTVADGVNISANTMVSKSITKVGNYTGWVPSQEHADWLKNFARLLHLDAMADKIRAFEARLAELENKL